MRVSARRPLHPPPLAWPRAAWRSPVGRSPVAAGLLATAGLLAALLAARAGGVLQPSELAAYDALLAARAMGHAPDQRLLQVSITETDLNRFGWPVPDQVLAEAIKRLHAAGARAIGIDVFRPSPIEPGAEFLAQTMAATPELVWVNRFSQGPLPGIQAPAAMEAAGRAGFADLVLDPEELPGAACSTSTTVAGPRRRCRSDWPWSFSSNRGSLRPTMAGDSSGLGRPRCPPSPRTRAATPRSTPAAIRCCASSAPGQSCRRSRSAN